ncbi:MAG: hypothetical protein H0X29_05800 [Parachlamydiaceae bacterium]|nr:hypothetical protein [Parachlamydiaceae bacterium]
MGYIRETKLKKGNVRYQAEVPHKSFNLACNGELCMDRKFLIDEWIALEISSRKSREKRRIEELLNKLKPNDTEKCDDFDAMSKNSLYRQASGQFTTKFMRGWDQNPVELFYLLFKLTHRHRKSILTIW